MAILCAGAGLVSCGHDAPLDDEDEPGEAAEAVCVTDPLEYALGYGKASPWFNVQTDCGALTLTACLQQRLDRMNLNYVDPSPSAPKHVNPVIYFPDRATPYLIDTTVNLKGIHGVTLLGQSPAGTVLKWNGPAPSTWPVCSPAASCQPGSMLWINGSDSVTIKRMTLDGAGASGTATSLVRVAFWSDADNFQATHNSFEDLRLKNAAFGIRAGGATNAGDDHNTIRRVSFDHLSEAGFSAEGFQALNTNIWDSSFTFCNLGVTSNFGNFNVYNSNFQSSTIADIKSNDGEDFTVQGNFSARSPRFVLAAGGGNWLIQNNKVSVASPTAIYLPHVGSGLVVDNVIQTENQLAGSTEALFPVVAVSSRNAALGITEHANLIVTGNWFNQAETASLCVLPGGIDYDQPGAKPLCEAPLTEQALSARPAPSAGYFYQNHFNASLSVSILSLPPEPTNLKVSQRAAAMCYDPHTENPISPCAYDDAQRIQDAITAAAASGGNHAVVHLPAGIFQILRTITVPAGKTIEIIGDGDGFNGTVLRWTGPSDDYMFDLPYPSRAAIHDVRIENVAYGSGTGSPTIESHVLGRGIHLHSHDADDGVVYFSMLLTGNVGNELTRPRIPGNPVNATDNVGFSIADVDHLHVWSEASGTVAGDVSVRVHGAGHGAASMNNVTAVKLFGAVVTGTHKTQFEVTNHGNLYVNGFAAESNTHAIQLGSERVPDPSGRLTIVNGKEGASTGNTPVTLVTDPVQIRIADFKGDVSLFGLNTTAPVSVLAGSADNANVLVFGNVYTNGWQWLVSGSTLISSPFGWNENGPATPVASIFGWPPVYSKPWSASYIDCAGYVADDQRDNTTVPPSYVGYPGATAVTQSPSSSNGFFKVAGATSASNVRFLNNTMGDSSGVWPPPPHACADTLPPGSPAIPIVTPAIDLALTEVRNAALGNAGRPCSASVTDARFFHVAVGARFTHNAFAVDPY